MGFAGLYIWGSDKSLPEDHEAYWPLTATILTRETVGIGNGRQLQEGTPVTLSPSFWDEWLDADEEGVQSLVDAAVAAATPIAEVLERYPVEPLRGDGS